MFSLPFANCLMLSGAALLGHFDMLLISHWCITIFIPNDYHGNELFAFHEHLELLLKQKTLSAGHYYHSIYFGFLLCSFVLKLQSLPKNISLILCYTVDFVHVSQSGSETWHTYLPPQWALTQHYTATQTCFFYPFPFSSKAETCHHSSNGKLSLRPRWVFPTDRIHHNIVGFLLWNLKPGSTEWPIELQVLSRIAYYEIKYNCLSQTYALGPWMVSIMYLFMFAQYHFLALCEQNCWHRFWW